MTTNQNEQLNEAQREQMELMNAMEVPTKTVKQGEAVEAKAVAVTEDSVLFDIGTRNEAILSRSEVNNEDGSCSIAEGDTKTLYVSSVKEDEIILSTVVKGATDKQLLRQYHEQCTPVEGRITGMNKGGFNVTVLGKRAFCPFSSIDLAFPEDPQSLMGKVMDFTIARIENRGNNIVLSRIPLLEEGLKERFAEIEAAVESKEPLNGTITRVTDFGAFVDLGGVEGLVHISELTWDRDETTASVVSVGQNITVSVLSVEKRETLRDSRISLSVKRLSKDPWDEVLTSIQIGQVVEVEVARIVGFGAFVKIVPGVEGLIRTEEMGWTKVRKPSKIVSKGEKVKVTIISIDKDNRKIDCSLRDFVENPWEKIKEEFPEGSVVTGTVADKKEYGYFVDLREDITGLLRTRRIGNDKKNSINKGDQIEVRIDEVSVEEQRVSLSYGDVPAEDRGRREFSQKSDTPKNHSTSEEPVESDLAIAMKRALAKKKR